MSQHDRETIVADGLFNIPGAMRFSGWSRTRLFTAMRKGHLAYVKSGRQTLIPRRELVRALAADLVVPTAAAPVAELQAATS
jgi:hypothetical protein